MVMRLEELRVGNLVQFSSQFPLKNNVTVIKEIKRSRLKVSGYYTTIRYTDIEPILLTEGWLIKLGFFCNSDGFYTNGRFTWHNEHGWEILSQWVNGWVGLRELRYVHELQNLYFALVGKELNMRGIVNG